jgi:hypothetical protein
MIGTAQSAGDPVPLRATEDFWLVMSKDSPMQFSFDGKTIAQNQVELLSVVLPGEGGKAKLVWFNYFGEGDASAELDRLANSPSSPEPAEPAGEAESVPAE